MPHLWGLTEQLATMRAWAKLCNGAYTRVSLGSSQKQRPRERLSKFSINFNVSIQPARNESRNRGNGSLSSASNTTFSWKHYFQARQMVASETCMVAMPPDNAHPGSSVSCTFGKSPQPHPRSQVGLTPLSGSTGRHMTQEGPANDSSLSLAQVFVKESACHPSQRETSGDFFFPGKSRKRYSLYWD